MVTDTLIRPAIEPVVFGRARPRIWTRPLRPLTRDASYGWDVIDWAAEIGRPLYPWQRWLAVHAGELLPDGRPRFRVVLVLVARQNGKTELLVVLCTWWQFVAGVPMILGTSTKLDYARESWAKTVKLVTRTPSLDGKHPYRWTRETNGEQESWTHDDCRYKIAASNAEGGRSLTLDRLVADELRQHHDYSAWDAAVPAGNAVPGFQAWALSNAGDDQSVVLNDLRELAIEYIQTGQGDPRVGLFEWSSPPGADPEDVGALAQANPMLGHLIHPDALLGPARLAKRKGGKMLTGFRTEYMCQRVPLLDAAIDPDQWAARTDPGTLDSVRSRLAAGIEVAPDGDHACLVVAGVLSDGRVRVEVAKDWSGPRATDEMRRDLPGLLSRIRPKKLGWLPRGPAAAVAADLSKRRRGAGWPPHGTEVEEIRGDVAAVCMGLEEQVRTERLAHSGDPLLNAQVAGAQKAREGAVWVFGRGGASHVDAVYGMAVAVHLARTLPPPVGRPRVVTA